MKITAINGTEQKGCTYQMKEQFLDTIGRDNEIVEYWGNPKFCVFSKRRKIEQKYLTGRWVGDRLTALAT